MKWSVSSSFMKDCRRDELTAIRDEIRNHASNAWATERGYDPIYSATPRSKIVVIGQAPGRSAQEIQIPWNDASGIKLQTLVVDALSTSGKALASIGSGHE